MFKFSNEKLKDDLLNIYPSLKESKHAKDSIISRNIVRNTMSAIVNKINLNAIEKINNQNKEKQPN